MGFMTRGRSAVVALASVYLIVVSIGLFALFSDWHYDDPFITYRYSSHLARGLGLVYNVDERVLSTTTPLFAVLLALVGGLGGDIPTSANAIGCISLAAGGLCLWGLGRAWSLPVVGWTGLLLYPTVPLLLITIGSETPLYLAVCLGAFVAFAYGRFSICSACCALAVLLRGDGALVALVLVAAFALRWRAKAIQIFPWSAVAVFAAILLAWLIPAWLYFGQLAPATLAAKRGQGQMAISQAFGPGLITTIWAWFGYAWSHRILVALTAIGLPCLFWRGRAAGPIVAWAALYFAAYSALGVSSYYWYYAPLVPAVIVLAGLGLTALADGAHALARGPTRGPGRASGPSAVNAVGALVLGALALLQLQQTVATATRPDARYAIYRAAGEWLSANAPANARVGALEVGIVGYFADRAMIDFAGLIQPDLAGDMRRATTYDDTALLASERHRPDYVLMLTGGLPRFERDFVQPRCSIRHRLAGSEHAFTADLLIYECRQ
jgi:hypothetical protein